MNALVHADHYKSAGLFCQSLCSTNFIFLHFVFIRAFCFVYFDQFMICWKYILAFLVKFLEKAIDNTPFLLYNATCRQQRRCRYGISVASFSYCFSLRASRSALAAGRCISCAAARRGKSWSDPLIEIERLVENAIRRLEKSGKKGGGRKENW